MVEEAQKLGIDVGNLAEYGFDVKSSKCGGKTCLDKEKFRDMNVALDRTNKFRFKMVEESKKMYSKAKCHPWV